MSAWAKPGVKCVCVNDRASRFGTCSLVKGNIYTITKVLSPDLHGSTGVIVAEAESKARGFHLHRFRPLVTKTQDEDIALFRHHLDQAGVDA